MIKDCSLKLKIKGKGTYQESSSSISSSKSISISGMSPSCSILFIYYIYSNLWMMEIPWTEEAQAQIIAAALSAVAQVVQLRRFSSIKTLRVPFSFLRDWNFTLLGWSKGAGCAPHQTTKLFIKILLKNFACCPRLYLSLIGDSPSQPSPL